MTYLFKELEAAGANDAVQSGPGVVHAVTVCTEGDAASEVTIRDSLTASSGTVIASIKTDVKGTYIFDAQFVTGLSINITGTTAPKITVSYR